MSPEEQREIKRVRAQLWRDNNRERHREYQRNYRLEHAEECKARNDKWRKENPEKTVEYGRKYTENHPGANNESSANWRRTHVEHKRILTRQRRAKIKEAPGTITTQEWESVRAKYGPACLCCGEIKPLTMDHVVPIVNGGHHVVGNVQPLCLSCNSSKGTKTIDYRPDRRVEEKAA